MTIDAKVLVASAFVLIANCFGSSLNAAEMIKNKSPDGKFALRLIHGEEGWETSIVELPSKKKIIDIEVVATSGDHERRTSRPRRRSENVLEPFCLIQQL